MAEEIKVSQMAVLENVPDDAKIYVVIPGITIPYAATKADFLAGLLLDDSDDLVEGLTNLYFTDARALAAIPDADATTKGISKLYVNLLASNTDGSVHQKALVDEFLLYLKKPVERTGYVMAFDRLAVYNDFSIATSISVITNNLVNAQKGIVQKMTIKTSSLNPFPAGWVLLGFVRYTPGALTNVYCEWISGSRVEYWLEKPTS